MTLGAELGVGGAAFEVDAAVAERVELCLFDDAGAETDRVDLVAGGDGSWSTVVPGVEAGQRYGYRVDGPGDRARGHACDPAKLLVDPAARRLAGALRWHPDLVTPGVDSAPFVPKSVVVAAAQADRLATPTAWDQTFVYEAHVGHLTARHPAVPTPDRGRYPGLAAPAVVDHLRSLGVSAVELLPVQAFVSEADLAKAGQRNVWGYNPVAWGAPHEGYATDGGDPVAELRAAVAELHAAGIEVWLDVVFNHTAEGALASGPTLSWRGFDNAATYRMQPGDGGLIDENLSGCGNTVDTRTASVRRLIVQLLQRWVRELGIDGFRFDLATALIRDGRPDGSSTPDARAALLADLRTAGGLDGVKLVAEPWDLGTAGYAPDQFPAPWRVWNDRFRDDVRAHWAGAGSWSTLAARLAGSRDLFGPPPAHEATVGVNAVVTHDGHTLADSIDDPVRRRAMLATTLVAQGVPMLASGDELGRSQDGERDGYRLEPDRWGLDWTVVGSGSPEDLTAWLGAAVAAWHEHAALRRPGWVAPGESAIRWFDPHGAPMDDRAWNDPDLAGLAFELAGPTDADRDVVVLVSKDAPLTFQLPGGSWRVLIDSVGGAPPVAGGATAEASWTLDAPGVVVLVAEPAVEVA